MNKNTGMKNYINMSEDNINNKFNSFQLQNINKNNNYQNNNSYFRQLGLANKNKLKEENHNKELNDLINKNEENIIKKSEKKENNKEIKNDLSVKDKIISNNNNDIKNMIRDEKRNSCDNIYNKNNNEYKNLFEKYRINDSSINDNKKNESYKIKDINQQEKFKSTIEKIPNVLPENNNKEDEDKQFQSDFDDLLS